MQPTDHFLDRAKDWDAKSHRVLNARQIAQEILNQFTLSGNEHVMDFGAGTGLLSWFLAENLARITAVDFSEAMLEQFKAKNWPCVVDTVKTGIEPDFAYDHFDGIISSMTMHHISDTQLIFEKFYKALKPGGFIAIGDLLKEDGSFHSDNSGVFHFGFEEKQITTQLKNAGFSKVRFKIVHEMEKSFENELKKFPVFLLTGIRKS